jgi:pimeloyl-ACP methyl ester carboxylesterase
VKTLPWFGSVHACDRALFESARRMVEYDSAPSWARVRCPVLVLYGGRDSSSGPPEPLVAIIRRGLQAAGNRDVTVKIFPDADHALCRAWPADRRAAGAPRKDRGNGAGPDLAAGYLETMTGWLMPRFGRPNQAR